MVRVPRLDVERYRGATNKRFTTQVTLCGVAVPVTKPEPWWIWKLISVKASTPSPPSSETPGSGPLPSYDGDTIGQPSTNYTQHAESERDEFGTIVTEVTTTVITTRKKYRVEDP